MNDTELNIQYKGRKNEQIEKSRNVILQKQDEFVQLKTPCEACRRNTCSILRRKPETLTWLWCALTLSCTLCVVPFYMNKCNRLEIYCADCLEIK